MNNFNFELTLDILFFFYQMLNKFEVLYDNVVAVDSDSAPYMNKCVRLLKQLVNPKLVHIQCWDHKLDKVTAVFHTTFTRLNECVSKTKKLFKNTRKRKHNYLRLLKKKYPAGEKTAKLFPLPVMTRWGSWKKSVDYLVDYLPDVIEYAKTVTDKKVQSVKYFKGLSDEDVSIILAEATFMKEHSTPMYNLVLLLEGSKYPMAHRLYPKLRELLSTYNVFKNTNDIVPLVSDETKKALEMVQSDIKRKNLERRILKVASQCVDKLTELFLEDTAHDFFEAAETLFHPPKIMTLHDDDVSRECILKAKRSLAAFDSIPDSQFLVKYGVFKDEVKSAVQRCDPKVEVDTTDEVLHGMLATHFHFAIKCLQVIHVPVSNVDSERAFSAYSDIKSPKRCNLKAENAEIMLSFYFGDDFDDKR